VADVEKTIEIIFAGSDEVSGTIDTVSGGMADLGDKIHSITGPLAGAADNVLKLDAALMALAAGGMAYAFIKSSEFEGATIELQKILGDEIALLGVAQQASFDLSTQYGESSSSVLLSAANFKRAGFDVEASLMLTKSAMDLVIAGQLGGAQASELLISTLKGFKAPAEDAARLVDVLNEVSNNYATNVTELGIGMATLSPIANLMGFSFEETAGILTPVIEVFRSGTEASVALKMGLLKLIDDAKPVEDALASIGVSQRDLNGDLRSGKDILYDVATAFQTAEENDKLFLAAQLVGIRQAAKMVEVFNGLAKSTEITSVAMGAAGSAAREVAIRLESAEISVNRFKVGFENLGIIVGDQFRVAATSAIDGATDIELALQGMVSAGTFSPIFDALNSFSISLGGYLKEIAIAMPKAFEGVNWDGLLDVLGDLGDEFSSFFDGLDLTDPEDLAEAIQFVVDSMESLVVVTKGMVESFKPVVDRILATIVGFNALDDETKESAGNILGVAKAIESLGLAFISFGIFLGENTEAIRATFEGVIGSIEFMWDSLVITVEGLFWVMADWVEKLITVFSHLPFTGVLDDAIDTLGMFKDSLEEDIATRAEANLAKLTTAYEYTTGAAEDATQATKDFNTATTELPTEVATIVTITADSEDAAEVLRMLDEMPETKDVTVRTSGDIASFEQAYNELHGIIPDEKDVNAIARVDVAALTKVSDTIEEEIPSEKEIEILLQGDIDMELARIAASAELLQTSVEWTAKLNIAEVEASARIMESAFDSVDSTIQVTSDNIATLFGLLAGDLDMRAMWAIEDQIRRENVLREEAWVLQQKLLEGQIDYMAAKTDAIESGEMNITVAGEGLSQHMEAFMWEILSMIQVRANAEAAEFLIGVD